MYLYKYIHRKIHFERSRKQKEENGKKCSVEEREDNKRKGGFKLEIKLIKRGEGDELKNEKPGAEYFVY